MNTQDIIASLQNIQDTYASVRAFFYQKIIQQTYTNNTLAVYSVNYTLLLPSSKFVTNLNETQVNAQMQSYIDLCNELIVQLKTSVETQTNLFYEQIQNILDNSISSLNGFAANLLQAKYLTIFKYKIPYNMAFSEALFLNNIDLSEYSLQVSLNYDIIDFNNLLAGQEINLSKAI